MADSFSNIRADGVQKVPNAAARLALLPADGYLVEQLDNHSLWAYNQSGNTWIQIGGAGTGTVTSVGLSLPSSIYNISGSPVTGSGTLAGTFKTLNPNLILATPDGVTGVLSPRSLVVADIPSLPANQIPLATTTSDGYLSQSDWNTFNSKQNAIGYTPANAAGQIFTGAISAPNLSGTNTGDVSLGTANGLSLAGQVLSLAASSTSTTGALTSTDWNTFNGKQATITGAATSIVSADLFPFEVLVSNGSGKVSASAISTTTLSYLDATSSIQTQINSKANLAGATFTGEVVLDPSQQVNQNDAATIGQVAALVSGAAFKGTPASVATTANITLSGEQTIDGVLTSASRVLVKNQTTTTQNGIYVSASGAWTRSTDADSSGELTAAAITVVSGTTQSGTSWLQTTANPTIGSSPIVWVPLGITYFADGVTLQLTGNTFAVKTGGILDAQVGSAAAITRSKLANGTNNTFVTNNGSGVMQSTAVTASRVVVTDSNGLPTAATTTAAEIAFVNGVTSAIQTQINTKFATAGGTLTGAISEAVSTLTYGATINTNATLANIFSVTLTGTTALLANPTGAIDGQTLIFRVIQDGTGGRLLTYGSNFKFGTLIPSITLSTGANATDYIGVKYNAANTHFDVVSFNGGF